MAAYKLNTPSSLTLNSASTITIDAPSAGASNIAIGAANTTGSISVGSATAGAITVSSNSTIAIGNAEVNSMTINGGAGALDLDTAGALSINSSGGVINMGDDAVAQAINIGTAGSGRTITIGNASGATQLVTKCGTGGVVHKHIVTTIAAGGATTLTAAQLLGGVIDYTNVGVATFTFPTGAELASALPSGAAAAGDSFDCLFINSSASVLTLAAGVGSLLRASITGLTMPTLTISTVRFIFTNPTTYTAILMNSSV